MIQGKREMASERKYCRRLERILELCQIVFFGDETDPLGIVLLDWLNTRDKCKLEPRLRYYQRDKYSN